MIQTERWNRRADRILLSLDKLTYATREQLQIIEGLGGDRNASRILRRMEDDGHILSIRMERKVYYLSKRGSERVGGHKMDLKRSQIEHSLMRNDLYIRLGQPKNWRKEVPIKFNGEDNFLIPDAMFNEDNSFYFVEVDYKQSMNVNIDKIKRYSRLFKALYREYESHPTLIWRIHSAAKERRLSDQCRNNKIKYRIYY